MKLTELRTKTNQELGNLLDQAREKIRELRFKIATKQLKDVRELRKVRKTIAQILTLLKEKKNKYGKKTN